MKYRFPWGKKGFSLLEVLIAIGILSVSLLSIFNLQSTSFRGSGRAQMIATGNHLARFKMVQLVLELEKDMLKGEFPEDKEESGTFEEEDEPDYTWQMTMKQVDIPPPPAPEDGAEMMRQVFSMVSEQISKSTRELKLVVYWNEGDGEPQEIITLTTHLVKM